MWKALKILEKFTRIWKYIECSRTEMCGVIQKLPEQDTKMHTGRSLAIFIVSPFLNDSCLCAMRLSPGAMLSRLEYTHNLGA